MIKNITHYLSNHLNPYARRQLLVTKLINYLDYALANDQYTEDRFLMREYRYNLESIFRTVERLSTINHKTNVPDNIVNNFLEHVNAASENLKSLAQVHDEIDGFCCMILGAKPRGRERLIISDDLSTFDKRRKKSQSLHDRALTFHNNYLKNLRAARAIAGSIKNVMAEEAAIKPENCWENARVN